MCAYGGIWTVKLPSLRLHFVAGGCPELAYGYRMTSGSRLTWQNYM